ncbi:hypothetical protein K2X33_15330 [bacterium]|nr:hypothetical protein [bacterium]
MKRSCAFALQLSLFFSLTANATPPNPAPVGMQNFLLGPTDGIRPVGVIESSSGALGNNQIHVSGWAMDPSKLLSPVPNNISKPVTVHIFIVDPQHKWAGHHYDSLDQVWVAQATTTQGVNGVDAIGRFDLKFTLPAPYQSLGAPVEIRAYAQSQEDTQKYGLLKGSLRSDSVPDMRVIGGINSYSVANWASPGVVDKMKIDGWALGAVDRSSAVTVYFAIVDSVSSKPVWIGQTTTCVASANCPAPGKFSSTLKVPPQYQTTKNEIRACVRSDPASQVCTFLSGSVGPMKIGGYYGYPSDSEYYATLTRRVLGVEMPLKDMDLHSEETYAVYKSEVGVDPGVVGLYYPLLRGEYPNLPPPSQWDFPCAAVKAASKHGLVMMTLQAGDKHGGNPDFRKSQPNNADFFEGRLDPHVNSWALGMAKCLKDNGLKMLLRPAHEMNSRWYGWSPGVGTNSPDGSDYIHFWKHLRWLTEKQFELYGADKKSVKWVWSPNIDHLEEETNQPSIEVSKVYPGDDFVDIIAVDGYNWNWGRWKSFTEVFGSTYEKLAALSPSKPMMVAETGCSEVAPAGTSKAEWIQNALMLEIPRKFPRFTTVMYFNIDMRDAGQRDWRFDNDPNALLSIKNAAKSKIYHP